MTYQWVWSGVPFPRWMRLWRWVTRYRSCRVYWGSHGCERRRGHRGHHFCCCDCERHPDLDSGCVGTYPFYGSDTSFYGEDA